MALPTQSKTLYLTNKPTDHAVLSGSDATFTLKEDPLPELKDGEVLLKLAYLSNDPAQRAWIDANADPKRLYTPPVAEGDPMRAIGISKVVASKDPNVAEGRYVLNLQGWTEYTVVKGPGGRLLDEIPGVSLTQYLGALGHTGLTAYFGLSFAGEAKEGESIVISGAAGATGSMAVQIAKHLFGLKKVIGLAGTKEKCKWVESLGADVCICYRDSDWKEQLAAATEDYVDLYFDNVGGETLDFMLTRLAQNGRVIACGAIGEYNKTDKYKLGNWFEIIQQRLQIRGFIVTDYVESHGAKATEELVKATKEGKLKVTDANETIIETKFEDIPKTWVKLFEGGNQGKLITKLV